MIRLRRLRENEVLRNMVRETQISKSDLVYPVFIKEGTNEKNPVDSMPGIYQYTLDRFDEELERIQAAGIPAILIFGIPEHKDECGSGAYDENGITQRAVREIKKKAPELLIIADVCLCEYTSHGHCGLVQDGKILNDETLPLLAKMAVTLAKAGADMIAPSDMMDGHIAYLRKALDENGTFERKEFMFLFCIDGEAEINGTVIKKGETIFIPCDYGTLTIKGKAEFGGMTYRNL